MVSQFMALPGDRPPFIHPPGHHRGRADQIKGSFQSQRIQDRDRMVKIDVDGVVIGKDDRTLLAIPGIGILRLAAQDRPAGQKKE
jgi:hypothetical protein